MAAAALGLLALAPQLVQGVIGVVHSVERIFGHGQGQSKKQAALAMSGDLLNLYSMSAPALGLTGAGTSEVNAALSQMIDSIVAFYNATGVFAKSQKP